MSTTGNSTTDAVTPILESELTCPECGYAKTETMPTDACLFFYECEGCKTLLKPRSGDCCVFCSYGTVRCPPVQIAERGGGEPRCRPIETTPQRRR